ncbi:fibronectin type III and SPRY domain-containing protein 1-like [Acipenser oxyrinchus oxyrinchus]|uniref:Fibronectin type III and SPRY domain-containing protein 1 n=1 Tax=Acipenser oxyrinchus oxyrinchus TaxID=40147 RepID=A0AAD8CJG2_ACIOX|nr:fibronectin type III and SPRY domain-containing protein 1-like [Acipenser oxyrinchus oxyrinchus]
MGDHKDGMQKIITTLAVKNEEIQNFILLLKQRLQNIEVNSSQAQVELESEFSSLYNVLDELKDSMLTKIKQERASKTYELQTQLSACTKALESSEELLELANQTLCTAESDDFIQVCVCVCVCVVTMAPAFRLSLKAKVSDSMSHLMVDFSRERSQLKSLSFLPDVWTLSHCLPLLSLLSLSSPPLFLLSPPLSTAFVFKLDSGSSHQNLRVEGLSVEWDSTGGKVLEMKKEMKTRPASPLNSPARSAMMMSPKRTPIARGSRDRFTAESYTVLADTALDCGQHYWEVRFDKDSKAFAAGLALRSLGKFDQLGKTSASWCLHLNNWLQTSFTAKHNNKARSLEGPVPDRLGVHCSYEEGLLSFYNAHTKQLLHTFKTKFSQPVVPAFMVWNGSFSVQTGLQVPSAIKCLQKRNSGTSSSTASLT